MDACSPFPSEDAATTWAIATGIAGMLAGAISFGRERRTPRELTVPSLVFLAFMVALGLAFAYFAIVDPTIYCGRSWRRGGVILFPFLTGLLLVHLVGWTTLFLTDRRFRGDEE